MSHTIHKYAEAVVSGDIDKIALILSPAIKVMPPGSNQPNEGKGKTSLMLSAVATAVNDFKCTRTYHSSENWYMVLLDGSIDGTIVQFVDHVRLDDNDLVDHVDIFLRPASMAATLLEKVSAEIKKRMSV